MNADVDFGGVLAESLRFVHIEQVIVELLLNQQPTQQYILVEIEAEYLSNTTCSHAQSRAAPCIQEDSPWNAVCPKFLVKMHSAPIRSHVS